MITLFINPTDLEDDSFFSFPWWPGESDLEDIDLKVIVPKGLVIAMSKSNPGKIHWQHKVGLVTLV